MTPQGIVILGHFSGMDTLQHLRAVAPSVIEHALADGSVLPPSVGVEIYTGSIEGTFISGFGEGLAVHRGAYPTGSAVLETLDVLWISLRLEQGREGAVVAGPPVPIVRSKDSCTRVTTLLPMGKDLLMGVSDKNGRRLVRLTKR